MFRRILIGSGLLFACLASFATGNIASAASPSTNANNTFAAMQKTCAVIHIQLNGTQNTLTCLKSRGGQPHLTLSTTPLFLLTLPLLVVISTVLMS